MMWLTPVSVSATLPQGHFRGDQGVHIMRGQRGHRLGRGEVGRYVSVSAADGSIRGGADATTSAGKPRNIAHVCHQWQKALRASGPIIAEHKVGLRGAYQRHNHDHSHSSVRTVYQWVAMALWSLWQGRL